MPIIVTNPPALVEVRGAANKQTASGDLNVSIVVTEGAGGWPPMAELQAALLELFSLTATAGWVGTLQLRYESGQTLHPDLPVEPEPEPEPEPEFPAAAAALLTIEPTES
ncbi:MAG: hypothetical protein H0X35_10525 [Pseudonocardiales bacterium]|nr:hypothetical protein [Pseudonocardiales bacterium]